MEDRRTPGALEVVETCFARIYRNADEVYKTRKPVALCFGDDPVDLTTTEARHAATLEEERLNRRLAPDVSIGVVPVEYSDLGQPRFGTDASGAAAHRTATDWALHMRRLPEEHRADHRLAAGTLTDAHLRLVAEQLATFHELMRGKRPAEGGDVLEQLRASIELRIRTPHGPAPTPVPGEVEAIEAWQLEFLAANGERFLRRAKGDAIREGHGELSLDHVFVDDEGEVRILAGLEVHPRLRYADVAADIALLATDLGARHRIDLAERFVAEYARVANDFDLYPLLDFYSSLRACSLGKLDFHRADLSPAGSPARDFYLNRARRFFALAATGPRRPILPAAVVAMGGQVASGKSTVARFIARRIGAPVVNSDDTRDFLLGARLNEKLHEVRWERAYEAGFGKRVYEEVLRRAGEVLVSGRPVIIDGCFRSPAQRAAARELAERFGRPFLFVEASIARDVQIERLAGRAERDGVPLETWTDIADDLRAEWIAPDELPANERLQLDTSRPLEENASSIEARLPTWPEDLTG